MLETLSRLVFSVRFSSRQQQTRHIICVSIADHSRRWLLSLWFATMIEETGAADRVLFSKAEKWVLSIAEQRPSLDITCHHLRVLLTCSVMAYPSFVLVASKNSWGECYIAPSTSMCTHFNGCRNTKTTASHLGLLIGTLSNIRRVGQPS